MQACYHAGAGTNLIISSEPLGENAVIDGEKVACQIMFLCKIDMQWIDN